MFFIFISLVSAQSSELEKCCEINALEIRKLENETDTIEKGRDEIDDQLSRIKSRNDQMDKKMKEFENQINENEDKI